MFDYVSLSKDDVSAALSSDTAFLFQTIPLGSTCKALCVDNGYDVDVVVKIDGAKAIYLRSGTFKVCDLTADNSAIAGPTSAQTLSIYAPGGSPPGGGTFIADCMF